MMAMMARLGKSNFVFVLFSFVANTLSDIYGLVQDAGLYEEETGQDLNNSKESVSEASAEKSRISL